tara:strand:- start:144 stop:485 length:342 start_codon:yes stop_codon:yes gene_type:complete
MTSVIDELPGGKYPRKRFFLYTYPRVGFVVFEQNIIPWLVFFDQIIFQEQGVRFGVDHNVLYVVDFFDHNSGSGIIVLFIKVTSDPLFEIFGLTDVQKLLLLVVKLVNPWRIR